MGSLSSFKKLFRYIFVERDKLPAYLYTGNRFFCRLFRDDEKYVRRLYKAVMGRELDLDAPKTFTEKLQWIKLYDRRPEYTIMTDKYLAKIYVSKIIGEQYIIPTLGVWDDPDDIDFDSLPDQFVLKATHAGGGWGVDICRDKSQYDIAAAKKKMRNALKVDMYSRLREWPYKDIHPRIIAEEYLEDAKVGELYDYKFFCFNGVVKSVMIGADRFGGHYLNYYDADFNLLDIVSVTAARREKGFERPEKYDEMVEIASHLSQGIPHVRVDLYYCNGNVYFGELTFFDSSGHDDFGSEYWNGVFGSWIELPQKKRKLK